MLHPSYSDLMKVVNANADSGEHPVVNSRYSIVLATSKRARQIVAGAEPMVDKRGKKPLSMAIEELKELKVQIVGDEAGKEEEMEKAEKVVVDAAQAKEALAQKAEETASVQGD